MKILVTGGYGFIGSHVAERFFKEGHSVYVIDNLSTGRKENIDFTHRSFICDIEDSECERFFKTHSFDMVIHCAAQTDVQQSMKDPVADSQSNILGLVNMLNLSVQYGVKQFVFCSSAAVYGNSENLPITEEEDLNPLSPYGINKMMGEIYVKKWEKLYGLSALIYRFSNVYGPRQHLSLESGVIATFVSKLLADEKFTIHGSGSQTRDFIYVSDVADAIYRGTVSGLNGIYNLSSNTETSVKELAEMIQSSNPDVVIQQSEGRNGDIFKSRLDNAKVKNDSDWVPKYTLVEGLESVFNYYRAELGKREIPKTKPMKSNNPHPFLPYLENAVLFILFLFFAQFLTPIVDSVDFWLVYVLLAALLFGKTQSIIASVLAIGIYLNEMAALGREWQSLFVDNTLLAAFTIYLLVGLIVTYVVDRKKIELQFAKDELEILNTKYSFLTKVYEDTLLVKNQLQEQILKTEDGVGTVYYATRQLDSLEPEALMNGSIQVLEQTLKAKRFAIYLLDAHGFMRLAAKSGEPDFHLASSVKVVEHSLFRKCINTDSIVFNTSFTLDQPAFAAPIHNEGKITAVIASYDVGFEQLTLAYRNLIDVVARLIGSALGRANEYMEEIKANRFYPGTHALTPVYFHRMLEQKQKAYDELKTPYVRLNVLEMDVRDEHLHQIADSLRSTDYFGFDDRGALSILLSNATVEEAQLVIERLHAKSIKVSLERKEFVHAD